MSNTANGNHGGDGKLLSPSKRNSTLWRVCVCVCVWCAGIPFSVFEQRDHHLQNKARTILQHAVYLGLCGSTCEIRRLLHFREFKGHNAMRSVTPNKLLSPQEDRRQSVNRNANED